MLSPSLGRRYTTPVLSLVLLIAACSEDKSPGPDTTPPAAVTDLTLVGTTETSATLTWTAPGDDGDRGQARAYNLRYSLTPLPAGWDSAGEAQHLAVPSLAGRTDTATVGGLLRDRVYYVALRTMDDAANFSALSNVVQAQTADSTPPGQVTDLRAVVLEPRAVTLQFTSPGDDGYVGTASSFEVRYGPNPVTEETWEMATAYPVPTAPRPAGYQERVRIAGFEPEATVHFALRARDDGGQWSAVSNDLEVTFPVDTVPPAAIGDLAVGGIVPFEAILSWTAPGNDGSEGRAASYAVRYATAAITEEGWESATVVPVSLIPKEAGGREELTVTDLPGGGDLWFSVRAVDERSNQSPVSNAAKGYVRSTPRTWVIRVDGSGDAPTVQAGIDSSRHGDTVLVGPGTYYENINMRGKGIHLLGEQGSEATVLDGSRGDNSVVTSNPAEYTSLTIEGFTITGGAGTPGSSRYGGGIHSTNTGLTLRGCRVRGNRVECMASCYAEGGGIHSTNPASASPIVIEMCVVEDNYASNNAGGLFLVGPSVIQDSRFLRNGVGKGDGAGMYLGPAGGSMLVRRNLLLGNTANDHGGGIYITNGSTPKAAVEVTGNLIMGNTALGADGQGAPDGSGGGCWMSRAGSYFHHNTVAFNRAARVNGDFAPTGGVHLFNPTPDARVEYNLIYANEGGGVTAYGLGSGGEHWSATLVRNLIFANGVHDTATGVFLPTEQINLILEECVFTDPQFCVVGPDSRGELAYGSPALTQPFGVIGAVDHGSCEPPAWANPRITTWEATRTSHAP